MKIKYILASALIVYTVGYSQAIYSDPIGNATSGADLISISASHSDQSWDFDFQFSVGTLDPDNFGFGLFLDTDLKGTRSNFLGYPASLNFGDDLYVYYSSENSNDLRILVKESESEWTKLGWYPISFDSESFSIHLPRNLTGETVGPAEFVFFSGFPSDSGSIRIEQTVPDFWEEGLLTAAIPEPRLFSLIFGLSVIAPLVLYRKLNRY